MKGQQLLNYFQQYNRIESKHRNHIAECIVEYYISNGNGKILKDDMIKLTKQIVEKFPNELEVSMTSYFLNRFVYRQNK